MRKIEKVKGNFRVLGTASYKACPLETAVDSPSLSGWRPIKA